MWTNPLPVDIPSDIFDPGQSQPDTGSRPLTSPAQLAQHTTRHVWNQYLHQLWQPGDLWLEVEQCYSAVPQHLFTYRKCLDKLICGLFLVQCGINLEDPNVDDSEQILRHCENQLQDASLLASPQVKRKINWVLKERVGLNYLIKEHLRYFWIDEGEPPRSEQERLVGFRFGDLVHSRHPGHPLHNWPCFVVSIRAGEDSAVFVRTGPNKPFQGKPSLEQVKQCDRDIDFVNDELVRFHPSDLARLPPLFKESRPYNLPNQPPVAVENFRDFFPTTLRRTTNH